MNSPNKINAALNALENLYWLDGLCVQLSGIHRRCHEPEAPISLIARVPKTLPFVKPERVGSVGGYEHLAADAYNIGVKAVFQCVGWEYVGLLTAIANETRGTPEWNTYYAEALAVINTFFSSGDAWKEFESYILEPAVRYFSDLK